MHHARAPALLLSLLVRHPEKKAAFALGAEQLAPAVVGEVGDVELVLLCGRSRAGRCSQVPGLRSAGAESFTHTCAQVNARLRTHKHTHTHCLTCQTVPEVGQADLLGAIEEQGALWVQGSHLRQQAQRSRHATLSYPRPAPGVLADPHLLERHRLDPFCFPHIKHIDGVLTEHRQVGDCITCRVETARAVQP